MHPASGEGWAVARPGAATLDLPTFRQVTFRRGRPGGPPIPCAGKDGESSFHLTGSPLLVGLTLAGRDRADERIGSWAVLLLGTWFVP